MTFRSISYMLGGLTLSGCMMTDPSNYLIGRQGADNVYEYSVTRYADARGAEGYYHQRDMFALRLCPQGYRMIEEREGVTITPAGDRLLSENVIRIVCST